MGLTLVMCLRNHHFRTTRLDWNTHSSRFCQRFITNGGWGGSWGNTLKIKKPLLLLRSGNTSCWLDEHLPFPSIFREIQVDQMVVSYWRSPPGSVVLTVPRFRSRDILEWEQGCYPFKSDLFFSLRIISFYTINSVKRERERGTGNTLMFIINQ